MLVRLAQSRAPGEARLIARSSTCAGAAWRLFVAAIFLILSAHSGYAQLGDTCPPRGGQALMAVPTGEGLMGYLVGTTIKATNGDQVQFWCVKSNSGTDYGYLNATMNIHGWADVFFAGGQNQPSGQVTLGIVNNRVVLTGFGPAELEEFRTAGSGKADESDNKRLGFQIRPSHQQTDRGSYANQLAVRWTAQKPDHRSSDHQHIHAHRYRQPSGLSDHL